MRISTNPLKERIERAKKAITGEQYTVFMYGGTIYDRNTMEGYRLFHKMTRDGFEPYVYQTTERPNPTP